MKPQRRLKIYFDGGCRPNPGAMEIAVVMRGVAHISTDLGQGDNNDAEWLALIAALRAGLAQAELFDLLGDSTVAINQAKGVWPCRSAALRAHLAEFQALAGETPVRIRRIGRAQNLAGIALARRHPR